jgi:hypothetical protein
LTNKDAESCSGMSEYRQLNGPQERLRTLDCAAELQNYFGRCGGDLGHQFSPLQYRCEQLRLATFADYLVQSGIFTVRYGAFGRSDGPMIAGT